MTSQFSARLAAASAIALVLLPGYAPAATFHLAPNFPLCKLALPFETIFKEGTPYLVARKRALAIGFKPFDHVKHRFEPNFCDYGDAIAMCEKYREIDDCSVDGYCAMDFIDTTGNILRISTYGAQDMKRDKVLGRVDYCVAPNGKGCKNARHLRCLSGDDQK